MTFKYYFILFYFIFISYFILPFFLSPFFLPFSSPHFFPFFLLIFPSLSLLPLAHHSTHTSGTAPSPLLPHLSPFFFLSQPKPTTLHHLLRQSPWTSGRRHLRQPTTTSQSPHLIYRLIAFSFLFYFILFYFHNIQHPTTFLHLQKMRKFIYVFFFLL